MSSQIFINFIKIPSKHLTFSLKYGIISIPLFKWGLFLVWTNMSYKTAFLILQREVFKLLGGAANYESESYT